MEGNDTYSFKDLHFVEEDEGPALVARILENRTMLQFLKFFNLSVDAREYVERLKTVSTVTELQHRIMVPIFQQIFEKTTDGITQTNIDIVPRDRAVLYLSNHRDIILDSGAMNMLLYLSNIRFGNAGIGDNLLMNPPVTLVFNIMKCFVVKRALVGKEQVRFLRQLSNYIAYSVLSRENSIWLAQGSGRAKDGNDRTNPAVLKMISMAGGKDPISHLKSLRITTTSCSYKWDPCDAFKTKEVLATVTGTPYVKQAGEDMISIQTGICGHKGGIHIAFDQFTEDELETLRDLTDRERYAHLAKLADIKIHGQYKLWSTNYIALDLLNGSSEYIDHYTEEEKRAFIDRMESRLDVEKALYPKAKQIFLEGYASPVLNQQKALVEPGATPPR